MRNKLVGPLRCVSVLFTLCVGFASAEGEPVTIPYAVGNSNQAARFLL